MGILTLSEAASTAILKLASLHGATPTASTGFLRGKGKRVKAPKPQIIAIGGGGFAGEPENPALELYILAQARKRNPSVCFVPTASGDHPDYIAKFYAAFTKHRCRPSHLPFFNRTPDLRTLLEQDVIYVGGGNTKSMLTVWRDWQLPKFLRQAANSGTVLTGISAGAICWFDAGSYRFLGPAASRRCAALAGCHMPAAPHYDSEKDRRPFNAWTRQPSASARNAGARRRRRRPFRRPQAPASSNLAPKRRRVSRPPRG